MDERIVIAFGQALGLGGHVSLVEISQEHGRQALDVADAGTVVVPRRARGLVCLVEIPDVHLVHEPEQ